MAYDSGVLRIAILGDTHGVLDRRIAEAVARCDYAVHTGDVGCAGILDALRPRQGLVVTVRGNNDVTEKWPHEEIDVLETLPLVSDSSRPSLT